MLFIDITTKIKFICIHIKPKKKFKFQTMRIGNEKNVKKLHFCTRIRLVPVLKSDFTKIKSKNGSDIQ